MGHGNCVRGVSRASGRRVVQRHVGGGCCGRGPALGVYRVGYRAGVSPIAHTPYLQDSKIGGIIFCRMSSSRLPGKAMIKVDGVNLLERVIKRSKKITRIDHLSIATSTDSKDDIIESFAKNKGIDVYRGDSNDVLSRAVNASRKFKYQGLY